MITSLTDLLFHYIGCKILLGNVFSNAVQLEQIKMHVSDISCILLLSQLF